MRLAITIAGARLIIRTGASKQGAPLPRLAGVGGWYTGALHCWHSKEASAATNMLRHACPKPPPRMVALGYNAEHSSKPTPPDETYGPGHQQCKPHNLSETLMALHGYLPTTPLVTPWPSCHLMAV